MSGTRAEKLGKIGCMRQMSDQPWQTELTSTRVSTSYGQRCDMTVRGTGLCILVVPTDEMEGVHRSQLTAGLIAPFLPLGHVHCMPARGSHWIQLNSFGSTHRFTPPVCLVVHPHSMSRSILSSQISGKHIPREKNSNTREESDVMFEHTRPDLIPRWGLAIRSRWWVASLASWRGMGSVAVRGLRLRLAVGGSLIRGRVGRLLLLLVARLRVVGRWSRGVRPAWRRSIAAILRWRRSCGWRTSRTPLILGVVGGVDRTEHQLCALPKIVSLLLIISGFSQTYPKFPRQMDRRVRTRHLVLLDLEIWKITTN